MNNLGLRTELGDLSRDAIVESGADGDHKIGIMDGHVRGVRAVHAHHAEREIVRGGESPEGHQRHVHRNLREFCELHQLFMCIREDRPAADVQDRVAAAELLLQFAESGNGWVEGLGAIEVVAGLDRVRGLEPLGALEEAEGLAAEFLAEQADRGLDTVALKS